MGDKDDSFSTFSDEVHQTPFKHLSADMYVHRRQWVVHQEDIAVTVERPCHADALLLTTTEVDTTFTDLYHQQTPTDNRAGIVKGQNPLHQFPHSKSVTKFH